MHPAGGSSFGAGQMPSVPGNPPDLNGNMTGSAFADTGAAMRSVAWSSFNKPVRVADALGLAASEFVYGPSRARVKQTVFDGAAVSRTVTYIGKDFERRAFPSGPDHLVHYIRAGGAVVAEVTKRDDANPATDKTRYLHRDHLGSVALVTDETGAIAEARSFGPWGEARNADWSTPAAPPPLLETPRGFTGHEHLQTVGLIHMNGRVYDPKIGRFMSPDPSDALDPGVGFNRYAYVKNNPVSLVDPSGFYAYAVPLSFLGPVGWGIAFGLTAAIVYDAYCGCLFAPTRVSKPPEPIAGNKPRTSPPPNEGKDPAPAPWGSPNPAPDIDDDDEEERLYRSMRKDEDDLPVVGPTART